MDPHSLLPFRIEQGGGGGRVVGERSLSLLQPLFPVTSRTERDGRRREKSRPCQVFRFSLHAFRSTPRHAEGGGEGSFLLLLTPCSSLRL